MSNSNYPDFKHDFAISILYDLKKDDTIPYLRGLLKGGISRMTEDWYKQVEKEIDHYEEMIAQYEESETTKQFENENYFQ